VLVETAVLTFADCDTTLTEWGTVDVNGQVATADPPATYVLDSDLSSSVVSVTWSYPQVTLSTLAGTETLSFVHATHRRKLTSRAIQQMVVGTMTIASYVRWEIETLLTYLVVAKTQTSAFTSTAANGQVTTGIATNVETNVETISVVFPTGNLSTGGLATGDKIALGTGIGLGVPALIASVVGAYYTAVAVINARKEQREKAAQNNNNNNNNLKAEAYGQA
jgi:hypothetical protein